ncbi:hypothetical protein U8607_10400 [Methylobacterium durans]|uniref:Uncharacterized protein n=1 Tax=Methylobacterium durans TaxID=2202825 RepID=A0A2U8W2B0_9HYPH|nr:hypothetical protein [Methylobacterium durans]AWN39771.1 hypothetical protein DK389_03515 [Methylobacterium durans]MEA1832493.1 hypothetical protein [Methylobacterium durans]
MRRTAAGLSALLGALLLTAVAQPARAGTEAAPVERTFLIPSSEGYGVGDCLTGGQSECGQVVANAWCESQGFAAAASYGIAAQEDYTGAIDTVPSPKRDERPIRITCQD